MFATTADLRDARGQRPETAELRVGLVVVEAINLRRAETRELTGQLSEALTRDLLVEVQTGVESPVSATCVSRPRCVSELGQELGVSQLLFVVAVNVGDQTRINVTWADAASGKIESRDPLQLDGTSSAPEVFAAAARRLLPDAALRPKSRPEESPPVTPGRSDGAGLAGDPAGSTGDTRLVDVQPDDRDRGGRRMTTAAWIVSGVGAGALAAGIGFAVAVDRTYGRLDEQGCKEMQCPQERIDRLESYLLASDLLFLTSAVAGAAAVTFYLLSGGESTSSAVDIAAGSDRLGIVVRGRF